MTIVLRVAAIFDGRQYRRGPWRISIENRRISALEPSSWSASGFDFSFSKSLLCPGFHDAHTHFLGAALARRELDLAGSSLAQLRELGRTIESEGRYKPEEWITGRGWSAASLGCELTSSELDCIFPKNPCLFMSADGHSAALNQQARARAGFPAGQDQALREQEAFKARKAIPLPALGRQAEALRAFSKDLAARGLTSLQDDCSYDSRLEPWLAYSQAWPDRSPISVDFWRAPGSTKIDLPRPWMRDGARKIYLDGSLGSRSAWLLEPYQNSTSRGQANYSVSDLQALVCQEQAQGHQLAIHVIGDAAARAAIDALANIGDSENVRTLRHRLEHLQVIDELDIQRLGELGLIASVQPSHWLADARLAPECLGEARFKKSYDWPALRAAGAELAFGSDFPIVDSSPWQSILAAVARDRSLGLKPNLEAALRAATWGAAWACHGEKEFGSLQAGLRADLCLLSPDPFTISDPDSLAEVRIQATMAAGDWTLEA